MTAVGAVLPCNVEAQSSPELIVLESEILVLLDQVVHSACAGGRPRLPHECHVMTVGATNASQHVSFDDRDNVRVAGWVVCRRTRHGTSLLSHGPHWFQVRI
jgi:hypothetical protein